METVFLGLPYFRGRCSSTTPILLEMRICIIRTTARVYLDKFWFISITNELYTKNVTIPRIS